MSLMPFFQPSFHGALGLWDEVLCGWLVVYMFLSGRQPSENDKVLRTGENPDRIDPPP